MKGGMKSNGQWFVRKDSKLKYLQKSKPANVSVFEFLADGCFETDWQSYCVSRMNGFSCGYWLESDDLVSVSTKAMNEANDTLTTEFQDDCLSSSGNLKSLPLYLLLNSILIVFILFVLAINMTTLLTMRKLGFVYLPICHYFSYICIFEQFDFFVISLDWFISLFSKYQTLLILQLMNPSSCQIIHMIFSACRHIVSGMTIGMAIDLCRFVRGSVSFLANYRGEWVKNVFILCMVIVCTINCQFFWTFDLNKGENKIIHGRLMSNYLECDFSNTLPLNPVFIKYIWPLTDHFLAEIFPIITCLISTIMSSYVIQKRFSLNSPINLSKVLINAPFVLHLTKCLIGFLILNIVTNFLPRIIYVGIKVIMLITMSNSGNVKTVASSMMERHVLLNYKASPSDENYQSFMIGFGNYIKYQLPFNILIRFFYFSVLLKEFRCISFQFLNVFKKVIHSDRRVHESNTADQLVTNSSVEKELIIMDNSFNTESKRKSLLVEIYC